MIRPNAHVGSTRLLAAVVPLLAATFGCTATVSNPNGAGGETGGSAGTSAQGGTSGKGSGGTGGASGSSGASGTGGSSGASGSSGAAGSSGSTGGTGEMPISKEPRPVSMEGMPVYSRFLRLTNDQWENSVHDILKLGGPTGASDTFVDAVAGTTDFDNNERVVTVDNTIWSDFQIAAEAVANQVTATDAALQAVVATTDPAMFIQVFGRRAFRRDLTAAEVTSYTAIHTAGSTSPEGTQSAFTKGANWVIAAMLQSPHFLYRVEMSDDGTPLSGYEIAAKLSLWIRDTTPTDAMLDAAKSGSYGSADGAATLAQSMLEEDATAAMMRKFHGQLYKIALFDTISKDNVTGYTPALNTDLVEASHQFFNRIFSQNLGVRDIITTNVGFVTPAMAKLYGITTTGSGMQEVTLTDRVGFYMQVPFLTMWARNNEPDSIHRGVRINLDTLCADPGVPNTVLPNIPDLVEGQTNRQLINELTTCGAVCHGEIINPIGFAFENYDGLGRYRTMDNGQAIDSSGSYVFQEGEQTFGTAPELMDIIANGTQAHRCYAKKIASYALERDLVETERPLVERLGEVSRANGTSLKQVMVALAKDDSFRTHVGGAQ